MTLDKARVAREMYDTREYTVEQIAKTVGVSRATIYHYLDMGKGALQVDPRISNGKLTVARDPDARLTVDRSATDELVVDSPAARRRRGEGETAQ